VVHTCNPSYSGGKDQEDHGSKPVRAKKVYNPLSQKPFTKIEMVEWLKEKPLSSNPSTGKKKTSLNTIILIVQFPGKS
jgi:hypothetical protein